MNDEAVAPEAEGEESYFVSMTDIMVGLLFVFIIMLMTFALRYRDAEAVKEEETNKIQSVDQLAEAARQKLLGNIKEYLEQRGLRVKIEPQQGVIRLPESVLFGRARFDLDADGRANLGKVARALAEILPCYTRQRPAQCQGEQEAWLDAVFVEGHTDDDRVLDGAYYRDNLGLSALRAVNAFRELTKPAEGAEATTERLADADTLNGLRNRDGYPVLAFSGYGERRPIPDNTDKAQNRRIDLRFLMAPLSAAELDALMARRGTVRPP